VWARDPQTGQGRPGNNRSEFVGPIPIKIEPLNPIYLEFSGPSRTERFWSVDPWCRQFYLMWFDKSGTKRWFSNSINDRIRMIFSFFFFFNRTRKSNHTYIITVVNDYYVIPFTKYFWLFWGRDWIRVGFRKGEIWVDIVVSVLVAISGSH